MGAWGALRGLWGPCGSRAGGWGSPKGPGASWLASHEPRVQAPGSMVPMPMGDHGAHVVHGAMSCRPWALDEQMQIYRILSIPLYKLYMKSCTAYVDLPRTEYLP